MGFISSLKRLFFVTESVTKSAAKKAAASTEEVGKDMFEKGSSLFEKTKGNISDNILDSAGDLADKAKNVAGNIGDKAKDMVGNVSEKLKESEVLNKAADYTEGVGKKILESDALKSAGNLAENVGGKILDTGENLVNKAKDTAEDVGKKILESDALKNAENLAENVGSNILDKGGDLADSFKNASTIVGGTILGKTEGIMDRAKEAINNPEESIDSIIEKAKGLADDIEGKIKSSGGELSDKVGYEDLEKSTLEGKDDFFSKADRFARGDYQNEGEGKAKIIEQPESSESSKKEPFEGDVHGFEDLDGDGDPIIDDAIIDE